MTDESPIMAASATVSSSASSEDEARMNVAVATLPVELTTDKANLCPHAYTTNSTFTKSSQWKKILKWFSSLVSYARDEGNAYL